MTKTKNVVDKPLSKVQQISKKFDNWLKNIVEKIDNFFSNIFASRKKTFLLLFGLSFTVLFIIYCLIIVIRKSFYSNFSDDILQYYTIISDFINKIKSGNLSFYNLNNYLGASIFSDSYYVPLDIFTFITLIISFFTKVEIAYSITEFIKLISGIMLFAYYLSLKGMKNRTIFWASILYFGSSGYVNFMAFPVFASLIAYLPLGLIVIHYYFKGKKWMVPLYIFAMLFYDFYITYYIMWFLGFAYLIIALQRKFKLKDFLLQGFSFIFLMVLGVIMGAVILVPNALFILQDTYRDDAGGLGGLADATNYFEALKTYIGSLIKGDKFFDINQYIRELSKLFTPTGAACFYGLQNNYLTEHISMYITCSGLLIASSIIFMNDKTSWIYKIFGLLFIGFIIFPVASKVFSGYNYPYTRWINFLPIFEILMFAHVFDKKGFEKVNYKLLLIPGIIFIAVLAFLFFYYRVVLNGGGTDWFVNLFKLSDKSWFTSINKDDLWSIDSLTWDMYLFVFGIIVIGFTLWFGISKSEKLIKIIIFTEVIASTVYMFVGPFSIPDKIAGFNEMHDISDFLEEHLSLDEFYRVYVHDSAGVHEPINFDRMTPFPTNSKIFHSFTDKETNDLTKLIFNKDEQQSKNSLYENQSLYINQLLGYKYVLIGKTDSPYLSEKLYKLVAEDNFFKLYEMLYTTPFTVQESIMSKDEFSINYSISRSNILMREKVLNGTALINTSTYKNVFNYNFGSYSGDGDKIETRELKPFVTYQKPTSTLNLGMVEASTQDGFEGAHIVYANEDSVNLKEYYRYDIDEVGFNYGSLYVNFTSSYNVDLDKMGNIFYKVKGEEKYYACEIWEDSSSVDYVIKCPDFYYEPEAILFEKSEGFNRSTISIKIRKESAIDGAAYLVYDIPDTYYSDGNDIIQFFMSDIELSIEKALVKVNDELFEAFGGEAYFVDRPTQLYIYKSGEMYEEKFMPSVKYIFDSVVVDSNNYAKDYKISIKNAKISLSYINTSDSEYDQIVIIPIAYSEEWIVDGGNFETLSANGGLLGIIVPKTEGLIEINLHFTPKGLKTGAKLSLIGFLTYGVIFGSIYIFKRRKEGKINEEIDSNSSSL